VELSSSDEIGDLARFFNQMTLIFELFFTTKPTGKGAGPGFSMSYAIIKEHQGDIRSESGPDAGADLIITLQAAEAPQLT